MRYHDPKAPINRPALKTLWTRTVMCRDTSQNQAVFNVHRKKRQEYIQKNPTALRIKKQC